MVELVWISINVRLCKSGIHHRNISTSSRFGCWHTEGCSRHWANDTSWVGFILKVVRVVFYCKVPALCLFFAVYFISVNSEVAELLLWSSLGKNEASAFKQLFLNRQFHVFVHYTSRCTFWYFERFSLFIDIALLLKL